MTDMTISEFCDRYDACEGGLEWAEANCSNMADAWTKLPFDYFLWVATRPGVLADRELRLGAVASARMVEHLMADQRSRDALDVAERHANGLATDAELAAARAAACAAAGAAAGAAAAYAADAAAYAADAAAKAAAKAETQAKIAQWYRDNTRPNFAGDK